MWYSIVTDWGGCTDKGFHDAQMWDSFPVRTRNCPDWRALVYTTGKELIKEYCQEALNRLEQSLGEGESLRAIA